MDDGRKREGEERNVRLKETNKQLNIKSVYLQFFSVPRMQIRLCQNNLSHGYPSRSAWPDAERASLLGP